jgi:hypothetical protein
VICSFFLLIFFSFFSFPHLFPVVLQLINTQKGQAVRCCVAHSALAPPQRKFDSAKEPNVNWFKNLGEKMMSHEVAEHFWCQRPQDGYALLGNPPHATREVRNLFGTVFSFVEILLSCQKKDKNDGRRNVWVFIVHLQLPPVQRAKPFGTFACLGGLGCSPVASSL